MISITNNQKDSPVLNYLHHLLHIFLSFFLNAFLALLIDFKKKINLRDKDISDGNYIKKSVNNNYSSF